MDFLRVDTDWRNPEDQDIELVERKGLGHPDTLADSLAEAVSVAFSRHCLDQFGVVLHHNVDKLYIGAGLFRRDFGFREMVAPVRVVVNGRMSNAFAGETFDIASIQKNAITGHLAWALPHLNVNEEVEIATNSTQYTQRPFWFSPRSVNDIPDAFQPMANDTSVCVAHWPFTTCERLAYELEQHFWTFGSQHLTPRYHDVGQDIKVMVMRRDRSIDATVCMPLISTHCPSQDAYIQRNQEIETILNAFAREIVAETAYTVTVRINPSLQGYYHTYLLATGSCIDCGEEGVVGRGNTNQGVISVFRAHTMEAPAGKNPVYHTGRVLGFLTTRLARALHEELGVRCSVVTLTKNGHSLVPPTLLSIHTDCAVPLEKIKVVIESSFLNVPYLTLLLHEHVTV